jgi:hypothetical protein
LKLPNADGAHIPEQKLKGYLLDQEHPVGGPKARFFKGLGFSAEDVEPLRQAFLEVARSDEAIEVLNTYGAKYVVDGDLRSRTGDRSARVRTVWLIERGEARPRFITAYPV